MSRHWYNPPTTKKKQRKFLTVVTNCIERDAPHLIVHVAALRNLEEQMYNRVPEHRGRPESRPMTEEVVQEVYDEKAADPRVSQHVNGARVGINQGRVCEVLRGVRV